MMSRLGSSISRTKQRPVNNIIMPNSNIRHIPKRWLSLLMLLEPTFLRSVSGSAWLSNNPTSPRCYSSHLPSSFIHRSNHPPRQAFGSAISSYPSIINRRNQHSNIPLLTRAMSSRSTSEDNINKRMKQDALQIIRKSIQAVDPYASVKSHFQCNDGILEIGSEQYRLADYDKIVLIAFGKASSAMATAVVQQLSNADPSSTMGICICKDDHATPEEVATLEKFGCKVLEASHPVPDQRSSDAAQQALELVQQEASPKTLVLCCISGGGSALFCRPQVGLTLQDLQETNQALLASGMSIQDCNVIRKRLEQGKGGRLALACHPSQLVTLVLSDGE